jgi:hypothetical protein
MLLDGPKPLKNIEKQTLFLILGHSKKHYQRGPRKSCFLVQNADMGVPGSTYRLIFDVLLRCQKIIIFGRLPDGPKNRRNRASEHQRVDFVAATDRQVVHFWPGGSQGPPRARGLVKKKTTRGAEEQLVRDLTRPGPMARRIFSRHTHSVLLI